MLKALLAKELRKRLRKAKTNPRKVINNTSDDDIIVACILCSCCCDPLVPLRELDGIITAATSADSFLDLCYKRQAQICAEFGTDDPSRN